MQRHKSLRDVFVKAVKKHLGFLTAEHDYSRPRVEATPQSIRIVYLARLLGIEIVFDWLDQQIDALVLLLMNGKEPDGYYVSSDGHKRRLHLGEFLKAASPTAYASWLAASRAVAEAGVSHGSLSRDELEAWVKVIASAVRSSDALLEQSVLPFTQLADRGSG